MAEPDLNETHVVRASRHWVKHAITLFLLAAVVVTGAAAYFSRNAWWEKYLAYLGLTH